MRNLLMTVMLLIVVALMFTTIITAKDGTRDRIENQGKTANTTIGTLTP